MHTEAFAAVAAKLKKGGRERLDGFRPSEFSGITEQERTELAAVFEQDNDFQALSALLSESEFAEILRNSIESLELNSDGYVSALIWAGKIGVIDDALDRLVTCICNTSSWAVGTALSFLASVEIPANVIASYIEALASVLNRKDATPVLRLKASAELLRLKGVKPKSAKYVELSDRLQAKDRRVRDDALAELVPQV